MKLKLTDEQKEALKQLAANPSQRKALYALMDLVLSKMAEDVIKQSLEQGSDLGIRALAHKRALHDGGEAFSKFLRNYFEGRRSPEED